MSKFILNCAVTGAIHVPSQSPYLPITPRQIAEEAVAASRAGAATVHLHARDPQTGKPSSEPRLFGEFCAQIRAQADGGIAQFGGLGLGLGVRFHDVVTHDVPPGRRLRGR